jgi:4-diphosphocytidyl-2-C-methyl-D-erythritol kinase
MSGVTESWPAPAKLNLFLHVTGRRADGYHELETLFQIVDICDEIDVISVDNGLIVLEKGAPGVPPEEDLVVRAARLLAGYAGRPTLGARLRVRKHIPMGAGLGGGSSDAATTLVALNVLWGLQYPLETLARLGAQLGADVPVFVMGANAIARGIGDDLEPVDLPHRWFAVVYPGLGVSTREVFQTPELTRNSPSITIRGFPLPGASGAVLMGHNDLQPVVIARYPAVRDALGWLGARGVARMTGSGACVFAVFDSRERARAALVDLPSGWKGYVVQGLSQSPLLSRLARQVGTPLNL